MRPSSRLSSTLNFVGASICVSAFLRYLVLPRVGRWWISWWFKEHNTLPLPSFEEALGNRCSQAVVGGFFATLHDRVAAFRRLPKDTTLFRERVYVLGSAVTTLNPDHALMVAKLPRSPRFKLISHFLGRQSVLFQDGERGKRDRHRLNVAFGAEHLQECLFPIMVEAATRLHQRLKAGKEFDPSEAFSVATLEVISQGGFGVATDEREAQDFQQLLVLGLHPLLFVRGGLKVLEWYHSELLARVDVTLTRVMASYTREGRNKNLLQAMMALPEQQIEGVDKKEWVLDNLKLFMFAGSDTTASALQFLTLVLALHPECQSRARQEVNALNYPLCFADLAKLKYVEACVKETLRLYPPAIGLTRVGSGAEVGGLRLPSGTLFRLDVMLMHRREDFFSRPDEFVPERWMEGESMDTAFEPAFLPFSSGPRSCIGKHFAMQEVKVMLAVLLRGGAFSAAERGSLVSLPDATPLKRGILSPVQVVKIRYEEC